MSDRILIAGEVATGDGVGSAVYVQTDTTESDGDAAVILLAACLNVEMQVAELVKSLVYDADPYDFPVDSASADTVMALRFTTASDGDHIVRLAGAKPECFNVDGTVDDAQADVANLIVWLLDKGSNELGNALTGYVDGERESVATGSQRLTAVANIVRNGAMVADFNAQDGADVETMDEE